MQAANLKNQTFLQVNAYEAGSELLEIDGWTNNEGSVFDVDTTSVFGAAFNGDEHNDDDTGSENSDFGEVLSGLRCKTELDCNTGGESIENVTWAFDEELEVPDDLYKHEDGSLPHEELRLHPDYAHLFDKPLTSFLAMLPLDFWQNVLIQTNTTAQEMVDKSQKHLLAGRKWSGPFSLDELMAFLGCLVIMGLGKSGSYETYWKGSSSMRVFMPRTFIVYLYVLMYF
jgi:hypothetical protein